MVVIFIIAVVAVLLDQLSKLAVVGFAIDFSNPIFTGMLEKEGESVSIIRNFFSFTYVLNDGAAFGILENQRWFFLIVTVIACVAGIIMLLRMPKKHWLLKISAGFLFGGAIGNLIDRVVIGVVRDFLDAVFCEKWFGFSFAVFNVADVFVVVGVILLIIYVFFVHDKLYPEQKKEKNG